MLASHYGGQWTADGGMNHGNTGMNRNKRINTNNGHGGGGGGGPRPGSDRTGCAINSGSMAGSLSCSIINQRQWRLTLGGHQVHTRTLATTWLYRALAPRITWRHFAPAHLPTLPSSCAFAALSPWPAYLLLRLLATLHACMPQNTFSVTVAWRWAFYKKGHLYTHFCWGRCVEAAVGRHQAWQAVGQTSSGGDVGIRAGGQIIGTLTTVQGGT